MKTQGVLLSLLLALSPIFQRVIAQDYVPILSGKTIWFQNGHAIAPVSEEKRSNGDVVFKHYNVAKRITEFPIGHCDKPFTGSAWIGDSTIKKSNGEWWFYMPFTDKIVIRTTAPTGARWLACDRYFIRSPKFNWPYYRQQYDVDTISYNLEAEVTSVDFELVDGKMDSVKTITLSGDLGKATERIWKFRVSKSNGLVSFPKFEKYDRPNEISFTPKQHYNQSTEIILTYKEVFDRNPGDEVQIKTTGSIPDQHKTRTCIGKDSIMIDGILHFRIFRKIEHINRSLNSEGNGFNESISLVYDTLSFKKDQWYAPISKRFRGQFLEGQAPPVRKGYVINPGVTEDYNQPIKYIYLNQTQFYASKDSLGNDCWKHCMNDCQSRDSSYIQGLGTLSNYYDTGHDGQGGSSTYERIVYYRKGSDVFGKRVYVNTGSELASIEASLYPNPIKLDGGVSFTIAGRQDIVVDAVFNLMGKRIPFTQTNRQVVLNDAGTGTYIVRLVGLSGTSSLRLVVD